MLKHRRQAQSAHPCSYQVHNSCEVAALPSDDDNFSSGLQETEWLSEPQATVVSGLLIGNLNPKHRNP